MAHREDAHAELGLVDGMAVQEDECLPVASHPGRGYSRASFQHGPDQVFPILCRRECKAETLRRDGQRHYEREIASAAYGYVDCDTGMRRLLFLDRR